MSKLILTLLFAFLKITLSNVEAQVFFQLEKANTTNVKRYQIGDDVIYRTSEFSNSWINGRLIDILPKDNAIVFYDKITHLDEITHVKYERSWAKTSGNTLTQFGIAWLSFAGIIEGLRQLDAIDTQYEFGTDTAIIGMTSIASGLIIKHIWQTASVKLNKKNRVRIIDVNF